MRKFHWPQIPWSPVWTTEPRYSSASIGIGTSEILLKVLSLSVFSSLASVHLHGRTVSWLILLILPTLQNHVCGEMMLIRYSLAFWKFSFCFRFYYFKLFCFIRKSLRLSLFLYGLGCITWFSCPHDDRHWFVLADIFQVKIHLGK